MRFMRGDAVNVAGIDLVVPRKGSCTKAQRFVDVYPVHGTPVPIAERQTTPSQRTANGGVHDADGTFGRTVLCTRVWCCGLMEDAIGRQRCLERSRLEFPSTVRLQHSHIRKGRKEFAQIINSVTPVFAKTQMNNMLVPMHVEIAARETLTAGRPWEECVAGHFAMGINRDMDRESRTITSEW